MKDLNRLNKLKHIDNEYNNLVKEVNNREKFLKLEKDKFKKELKSGLGDNIKETIKDKQKPKKKKSKFWQILEKIL